MKAVLLVTMGGPEKSEDVRGFLFRLLNDPFILRTPFFIRALLAMGISFARARHTRALYARLGGGSPIVKNTQAQAQALQKELGEEFLCRVGMLYSSPFVEEAIREIYNDGIEEVVLLPMYPQFSTTTTSPALARSRRALKKTGYAERNVKTIEEFQTMSGFIDALTENLLVELRKAEEMGKAKVLFSAHGIPESVAQTGDTYPLSCLKTVKAVIKKSGREDLDWVLCYQSRLGPMRWTKPYLVDEIDQAAKAGRAIVVVPVAFACEHLETLVELDMDMKERALLGGASFFGRSGTPACHEGFIASLASCVRDGSYEKIGR